MNVLVISTNGLPGIGQDNMSTIYTRYKNKNVEVVNVTWTYSPVFISGYDLTVVVKELNDSLDLEPLIQMQKEGVPTNRPTSSSELMYEVPDDKYAGTRKIKVKTYKSLGTRPHRVIVCRVTDDEAVDRSPAEESGIKIYTVTSIGLGVHRLISDIIESDLF